MSVESVTQLFPRAEQWDTTNYYLAAITENLGGLKFDSWKSVQGLVRAGLHTRLFSEFSQFTVERDTAASVTASSGLSATINMITFEEKVGTAHTEAYEFIYDGAVWKLHNVEVELSQYGLTVSGTPSADATLVVHITAKESVYDVIGLDYDVPSDTTYTHSLTICSHDVFNYSVLAYKKPQMLFYVDPTTYPNGLSVGTYSVTLVKGANDASTSQDGTYMFTTTKVIPAGGGIRHSVMGVYNSSGYTKDAIIAGKFSTYGTMDTGRQAIESNLATLEDTSATGTNLGTFTAEDISLRTNKFCNLTRRNAYGTNEYVVSDERLWMNSNAASGVDSNNVPNWFEFQTIFDLPASANIAGFLYGLDPELKSVIGKVKKRTYVHSADRADSSVKYVDTDELVFPMSMTECGFGTNDGVYETPVSDGTPKTTAYDYYTNASNDKRIKYEGTTARYWWLRSPDPSSSHGVRYVFPVGSLNNNNARNTYGPVPCLCII